DNQGSVANMTSPTGAAEWTYTYDPYGNARLTTQNDPNAPTSLLRYTGQLTDPTTGFYDLRRRMLDPTVGRFLEIDPISAMPSEPHSAAYVYSKDRPTAFSDPSGACVALPGQAFASAWESEWGSQAVSSTDQLSAFLSWLGDYLAGRPTG